MTAGGRLGVRQRLRLSRRPASSDLGAHLRGLYVGGRFSAQELCESATVAGGAAPELKRLATGSPAFRNRRGKRVIDSRNAAAKVGRLLQHDCKLHEPYFADVPAWDRSTNSQKLARVALLPIHETLDAVIADDSVESWTSFDETQRGFRDELIHWSQRVGVLLDGNWTAIALWGDSAPYTTRDSVFLLTFTALSGTHRSRFWIGALSKRRLCACGCKGRCTFDGIFSVVAWSMRALLAGRWPRADHLGNELTGWRRDLAGQPLKTHAACIGKCGDWAWHKQVLNMRGWRDGPAQSCCWLCNATINDDDFSLTAAWRRTKRSSADILREAHAGAYVSGIWSIPGFDLSYVHPDWMHTCDQGVLQYACGNILYSLLQRDLRCSAGTLAEGVSLLENLMKSASRSMGVEPPFFELAASMIRRPGKRPKLNFKAAEGRDFAPVLLFMLRNVFDAGGRYEQTRLHCLEALSRALDELTRWDPALSGDRLELAARQHLLLYVELRRMSDTDVAWHVYPKHHLWVHCSARQRVSPRDLWNYADEDCIGQAAKLALSVNVHMLHQSLVRRYRLQVGND